MELFNWLLGKRQRDPAEEERARVQRLLDENMHLIRELVQLVGSDGGFAKRPRIREIGETLNQKGGLELMQVAYYAVRNAGPYFSQDIWDQIGAWRE